MGEAVRRIEPGRVSAETSTGAAADAAETADLDALEELGEEIATLAAEIHAATHRLLVLVAEFDRREGWAPGGFRSCAHWLAFRTGVGPGAAREQVRAARALAELPATSEAMARGELSYSKVRALTRVAAPDTERELLTYARATTAAELERLCRSWRRFGRLEEAELERVRHRSRALSVVPGDDGMYVVRGRLDPEVGALLLRAIEAASDALYRRGGNAAAPVVDDPADSVTPRQRRADALGLLAERALAAGFGAGATGEGGEASEGERSDGEASEPERAGASVDVSAEASRPAPLSGTRAERYQVLLHVDEATLAGAEELPGPDAPLAPGRNRLPSAPRSHLEDGTRLSAETSRRLACDASVVRLAAAPAGSRQDPHGGCEGEGADDTGVPGRASGRRRGAAPASIPASIPASLPGPGALRVLGVGRKSRTVPPSIRRALEARDRGCRFPGCGLRFTDAHHVRHRADGGPTTLENLVLLCRFHHRLVHEEGFRVEAGSRGGLRFYDPRGALLPRIPATVTSAGAGDGDAGSADPLASFTRRNRLHGARPDGWTAAARHRRSREIPLETLGAAVEALAVHATREAGRGRARETRTRPGASSGGPEERASNPEGRTPVAQDRAPAMEA